MNRSSRRNWNPDASDDEREDDDEDDDEDMYDDAEPVYRVMNGQAWADEDSEEYEVTFIIGTYRPREHEGVAIACKGRLSTAGMTGTFRYLKPKGGIAAHLYEDDEDEDASDGEEDEEDEEDFELFTRQDCYWKGPMSDSFLPLTSGKFKLSGRALTNTLELLFTSFTLMLHPDGTLTGETDQALHYQTLSPLRINGTWTHDQILFTTTCKWSRRPDYQFLGVPSLAGLRGLWLTPQYHPFNYLFDSAVFDLSLSECSKCAWCEELHSYFAYDFREGVRLLLLSSLRGTEDSSLVVLPSDLWKHVLSFTTENWFRQKPPPREKYENDFVFYGCPVPDEVAARYFALNES